MCISTRWKEASDFEMTVVSEICHQISTLCLFPSDPVFPRSGTVQTGPMKWPSGVFWSAPGCSQITCPTPCSEHSTVLPATGPSPSAHRQWTTASTILSEDLLLTNVLPARNVTEDIENSPVVISVNEPDSLTRWSTSTLFICTFNYLTHIICLIPTLELLHEQLYAMNFECALCTIFYSAAVFLWSQCSTFHVCARAVWLVEADWKRPTSSSLSVGRIWKSGLIQDVRT